MKLTKHTRCDAQGEFESSDVADGYFYVTTQVVWNAGYSTQGRYLMQYVELRDGGHEKVVLTP